MQGVISYTYVFDEQTRLDFTVCLDREAGVEVAGESYPGWTQLERFRCECCPLPDSSRGTCPAALAIRPVVEGFTTRLSYEQVLLVVEHGGVKLESKSPTQNAVRSLIGLLLPLSSCPIMARLRPMAQLHLPLGSKECTAFRFIGMYLIAQYFRTLDGLEHDWSLAGLLDLLRQIRTVNRHLAERIRVASQMDATVNGLVLLDALADSVELGVKRSLQQLRPLFAPYLEQPPTPRTPQQT